jgi:hypothetical protein
MTLITWSGTKTILAKVMAPKHYRSFLIFSEETSTYQRIHLSVISRILAFGKEHGSRLWSRFEVHYTPTHASWLNQGEIAIGMFSRQCLGDGRIVKINNLKG